MSSTISVEDLMQRRMSLFDSVRATKPAETLSLADFLAAIRDGRWRTEIEKIRDASAATDKQALKQRLPAAKPSGVFYGQKADDLIKHSGLLCLDIDGLEAGAATAVRNVLVKDRHVVAVFASPRGMGLKVFVPVIAHDSTGHKACFEAAQDYFARLLPDGVAVDSRPTNVASNCFVSHDPNLWLATTERSAFAPSPQDRGCDVDVSHVMQSDEKELVPSSHAVRVERGDDRTNRGNDWHSTIAPPGPVRLPLSVEKEIWPKWGMRPHPPHGRNAEIRDRTPILLNVVHEDLCALMLLRWYELAPEGLYEASREQHWYETKAAIKGCLNSWGSRRDLTRAERAAYAILRDARQRATFRILRSLSLVRKNLPTRTFFISASRLGDRLGCADEPASRQLEYMAGRKVIELLTPGSKRAPGQAPKASTYRWLL